MILTPKVALIASAGALLIGTFAGWKSHNAFVHQPHLTADLKANQRVMEAAARLTAAGQRLGDLRRAALDKRQGEIRTVTNTILREVPRYVSSTVQCPAQQPGSNEPQRVALADVSVGLGMLHNYAAVGVAPPATPAAGVDLGAPSGAGMPEFARVVVSNYGQCHAAIAEVKAWRAWHSDDFLPWWAKVDAELAKAARR